MAVAAPAAAFASGHYHGQVNPVSRAKGHSIVAKASYRGGVELVEEATGKTHDYSDRTDVTASFLIVPENAPAWGRAHDLSAFANGIDLADPRENARLATELELGLPNQLTDAQRYALLSAFVLKYVETYGVAAHVAIHNNPGNIHAHVLISHRELGPDGFGEIANTRIVPRKRNGQIVQEKVAGIFATPEAVKAFRKDWEQAVNQAYEMAGWNIRVDCRSHKDRGIEDEPTIHEGPKARWMQRDGKPSDRVQINRDIKQRNADRAAAKVQEAIIAKASAEIIDLKAERAKRAAPQTPAALPRNGEAQKTLPKQQGDEIPPEKATTMQTPERPANQNQLDDLEAARLDQLHFGDAKERGAARPAPPDFDRAAFDTTEADARLREAWRQPAFSAATIEADPWTAVYLAIPQTPDATLLMKGVEAAAQCQDLARHPGAGPRLPQGELGPDHATRAGERIHELSQTVQTLFAVREPFEGREQPFTPAAAEQARYDGLKPEPAQQRESTPPEIHLEALETPDATPAPTAPAEAITPTGDGQSEAQRARVLASENRAAEQAASAFDAAVSNAVHEAADTIEATLQKAERVGSGFLSSAAAWVEGFISRLGDILASLFRPTELEREVAPKVAAEKAQEAADVEAWQGHIAGYDAMQEAERYAQQTRALNRELGYDHDGQSHEPE